MASSKAWSTTPFEPPSTASQDYIGTTVAGEIGAHNRRPIQPLARECRRLPDLPAVGRDRVKIAGEVGKDDIQLAIAKQVGHGRRSLERAQSPSVDPLGPVINGQPGRMLPLGSIA